MSWDDYADQWDEKEGTRDYARAAFDSLTQAAKAHGHKLVNARVFDFGCGTGLLTEMLAPQVASIFAVDTSGKMIARLEEKLVRLGLSNVTASATDLESMLEQNPASLSDFDFIVCSSVCSFVDDYPKTVTNLVRLLKPGGVFVQWDWEADVDAEDAHGLTRGQIREALTGAGLVDTNVDTAFEIVVGDKTMRPLMGIGEKPRSR